MQKLNDDDVLVNSSPTSVSSGYCSQWMSPSTYGFSKQSASERTLCTESEFESDCGVNQKLLREFHCIRPKTHKSRSKLLPSGVQVAKKKLTCARKHKKSVHCESEALKCVLLRLNSASFPHSRNAVRSSSPDLPLSGLVESPLKRYSLNSGHAINSDKLLASTTSSLSKKRSKWPKKCLASLCACKVRYLTVNICRLPAGIKSMNVKNIGNSLCWFQSATQMLDSKVRHKRTKNGFKQLHSNSDIIQLQSNSDCKQIKSCSYLKKLQSKNSKQLKSKSDVKYAKLSHEKKQCALTGVERQLELKCDVKHLKSNKCKDSSNKADIEKEHHKVTEAKHSCGVIHNSRSVSVKSKGLESYKSNAVQMQYDSFTKTNPVSLCRISDFNRPRKKRLNHEQYNKVTDTTYGSNDSTVHESPISHCVSASGFHSIKEKLDSHVSAFRCHSAFSSGKHNRKHSDTSENLIPKDHHTHRKVKCRFTGKSKCRCQQCHRRPRYSVFRLVHRPTRVLCKYVLPKSCHKQRFIRYRKHWRSSTNTEAYANEVLTDEADRSLSRHKSPYVTDMQNKLPQHDSETAVKPDRRNLFDTFLNEIPSTSQQNLTTEEITSKPEMSAIQNSGKHHNNSLMSTSDYSAKDLDLPEPSDLSVQLRAENSRTELFEASDRLLDTNDDKYSDISDDILPDAVSNMYDMFSDISDCLPDDIPVNESTHGGRLSDTCRSMLHDSVALWANDLHSLWLQSQCFSLPTSDMSLELIKTNATESHDDKNKEALLTPEDSSCSDNHHEEILNCQEPCSTLIQSNLSVSDNTCHTEIQAKSSSQRRPCSFMVTTISKGPRCSEIEEDDSLCKGHCSCGQIQTSEAPSPSDRPCCCMVNQTSEIPCSAESMKDSSLCEGPCSFGVNQTTVFTSDSVGPFSADVQEGSSPTSRGAAEESRASDGPCTYEKQRLHSCGGPSSNESHPGISPCGILYSLDVSQKSTSEELCSTESDENTLNSAVHECSAVESTNEGSLSPKLQEGTVASCASYIQNESASGLQSSAEIPDSTLTCEAPCRFLKTQKGLSSAKESESTICEHSSSEAFGSGNILETIHNSERIWSSNIYKENLTYEGPYEFGVNDDEQVPEIPCSGESFVLEIPFSEEGPAICNAEEGHLVLGATYSKEGSLVSDVTCFKEGPLTSERPCCKVGPLVTDVISEDSCSREELLISEEPCCKESPLVSNNGPLISDRSYTSAEGPPVSDLPCFKEGRLMSEALCSDGILVSEVPCLDVTLKEILTPESCGSHKGSMTLEVSGSDMLQIGLAEPQEGFSSVQDIEDLLTAGASCLSETNDVSLTLEDLFPFVLQEPSERFADRLDYEDLLSYEMQEGTPVESQIDNTQENSLIAPTSCIVTFQEELCKADILKNLLNSGKSGSKESEEPESNEMNSDNLETGSQSESFLAKFYEFTNVWRPSAASEYESDDDDTDREDDADSLDETRNECISDANGTSFETVPVVTMPHCPARAKTESWLQEYQLQMLENEERTHKNWKLLVSVIDDPRSGRCGRRKGTASGNWPRKRKSSPGTNKTRLQPKRLCATTQNFEQTEPERSEEDFLVLQQDFCSVDATYQSNFSFDGVMANFQNMVLNGDPSMLSMFIDQANTWLSMENTETIIDLADLGQSGVNIYSELELTTPLASDSLPSDNNTLSNAPQQSDLLDSASALPIQQPGSIVTSGLPGLALNSATSTDAQTVAMLSDNCGNIESLNVLSSDAGSTLQTVVPGFTEVSELDAEMLQYLLSVFPQLGHAGALPGISYNQSNEIVTNTDVNRGVIYVLNHSNCLTQLVDCGQILGGDPVQECNKPKTGSQCQVEGQTFTPVLILTNGNTSSAKVDNPTSTQSSDSGLCTAQNSSEEIRPGLFEGDPQPTQNNCPVVDIGDFRANNAACASNLEQQIDVVESESALLSVKHDVLESQQQNSNTLVLEKNYEISDSSGSSSAPLTDGYSDDHTHQNSAAVLLEKDCSSGTVLVEKGSELSRNECSDNVLAKSCSDSMSVHPLQNDLSNENNQNQSELPTGDKLLGHHDCGIEHLADSCRTLGSASGNYATSVDQQGTSGSEYSSDADLHQRSNAVSSSDPNGLSAGEDSLSDKSDPFVLTCEDAGDNADIFLEEAEDNCSETSDVIMLGCNDSLQNHWENDSETTHFNVAMSSAQEQHASRENDDASKDHGVSAVALLKGNQSSFENGNQKSKYFGECIQKNSKEGNQKSSDVVNGKSSEDSEIQIEEFNNNCYETSQHFLEADNNKSSKEACQAVRSGSCEEEVITKVVCSNLAKFNAANESNLSPNLRPVVLHPHGSVLILGDKLTSEENNKVKTKLKESKRFDRAEGKKSDTIKSQLLSSIAPASIPENTNRLRDKRASTEVNMVEIKLKKSKPISRTKRKPSRATASSQGLQLTAPDRIAQNRNDHDVRQTICSGGITEPSFNRSKEQTEENLNNSRVKEKSSSRVQTVEPVKVNSCTKHARTLKHCQNGIKLRIVKVRRGIWQTQSSTDPVTQQYCSHKAKSAASASNDNCTVSSDNLSSYQDRINISDESDSDTEDCLCIDDESRPPNNRLVRSAKRTISNQMTSFLPTSAVLHRIGCTCVSCAERQFLYGRDNTVSMFTDVSLTRGLMRYKRSLPANRNHSQINSVASVGQSPVVIDDLDGSNSDMPIHIS